MRWPRWGALGTFLIVVAMVAGSTWVLIAYRTGPHTLRNFVVLAAIGTAIAVLGLAVSRREPANPVGAILGWIGAIAVFLTARDVYYNAVVHDPGRLPLDSRVVAWLEESGWWLLVAVAFLLLYFPTGRLVSRRWRPVPPALAGARRGAAGLRRRSPRSPSCRRCRNCPDRTNRCPESFGS